MNPQKKNTEGKMEGVATLSAKSWNHYDWSQKYRRLHLGDHKNYFLCKVYAEDDTLPLLSFERELFEDIDAEAWRLINLMEADKHTFSLFVEQQWESPGHPYRRILEYQSTGGTMINFRIFLHPLCFTNAKAYCVLSRKN